MKAALTLLALGALQLATGQDCLRANSEGGDSLPSFSDPGNGADRIRVTPIQAIIKSYEFHCCGRVGGWAAFVEPGGGMHTTAYSVKFQIWRPEGGNTYVKIGESAFTPITLGESSRMEEELSSGDRLDFQTGDVVGYYLEQTNDNPNGGIQFDSGFNSEELFYLTGEDARPLQDECRLDIGAGGILPSSTDAGPIISVSLETTNNNCPRSFTNTLTCPPPVVMTTSTAVSTSTPVISSSPVAMTTTMTTSTSSVISSSPVAMTTTIPHVSTPCPVSTSTPVVMASVAPPVTTPPANIGNPPTTMGEAPTGTDGGEGTTPSAAPASDDGVGLVVGFVVVLMVVVLIAVVTVVLIIVLMRRRQRKGDLHGTTALNNPSYEEPIVSTSKSSKFTKRRSKNKAPPLSVNIATGDAAVYESVEGDYHGIPSALDYTYPTPSPTAVRFDRKSETVLIGDKGAYHDQGPDVGNLYDYCGSASGDLEASRSMDGSAVVYEDPTLPKFRRGTNEEDPFDVYGTYVPTLAQRQAMGSHYEYTEGEYSAYNKLQFFVEDQVYWAPADTASDLYQQLASKKYREIPRNQLNILEELGSGQFGTVSKCLWSVSGNALQLAVKTLKPLAPEDDKVKFLQEAAIMGQFLHPNVIKLYGVVTMGQPAMICLEIMSNGDLRSYLKDLNLKAKSFKDTQIMFLRFAKEIAAGMNYLSSKAFVHRDLAARNVLVNENLTCKIGDFGMARDLMDDTYYTSKGGKIPVKWTSPEALLYKKYSTDSDVWSYGMVLFEIWSVGQKPFSMNTNNEVLKLIQSGYVQCPPPGTPREIYSLMVECWNPEHGLRPKFARIFATLCGPVSKLLYWSPQDSQLSERTNELGASLEHGYKLHNDLTQKYKK